jgi:hypothetical protein
LESAKEGYETQGAKKFAPGLKRGNVRTRMPKVLSQYGNPIHATGNK